MHTYYIDTMSKINKDTSISLLSDLHINENDDKRYNKLLNNLDNIKPNYIFILGDLIDNTDSPPEVIDKIYKYLTMMSEIATIYYIYGNHETRTKIDGEEVQYDLFVTTKDSVWNFRLLQGKEEKMSGTLKDNSKYTNDNITFDEEVVVKIAEIGTLEMKTKGSLKLNATIEKVNVSNSVNYQNLTNNDLNDIYTKISENKSLEKFLLDIQSIYGTKSNVFFYHNSQNNDCLVVMVNQTSNRVVSVSYFNDYEKVSESLMISLD